MKQIYKQLISIILSVCLVGASVPAYAGGKSLLAVPGGGGIKVALFERNIKDVPGLFIFEGSYLFRALTKNEWRELLINGYVNVSEGTKFEKNIGPQIKYYMRRPNYSGIVAKIQNQGFYYMHAGTQDSQAVAAITHRVLAENILVTKTGKEDSWINVEQAKAIFDLDNIRLNKRINNDKKSHKMINKSN